MLKEFHCVDIFSRPSPGFISNIFIKLLPITCLTYISCCGDPILDYVAEVVAFPVESHLLKSWLWNHKENQLMMVFKENS
jgi:hypothetical protein